MLLIDDLLLAPARGLLSVFKAIHEQVETELHDQSRLRQELFLLQRSPTPDQAHREALEAALLSALVSARKRSQT
jgi:hypothetical protein